MSAADRAQSVIDSLPKQLLTGSSGATRKAARTLAVRGTFDEKMIAEVADATPRSRIFGDQMRRRGFLVVVEAIERIRHAHHRTA